jgi:hypothetical protein
VLSSGRSNELYLDFSQISFFSHFAIQQEQSQSAHALFTLVTQGKPSTSRMLSRGRTLWSVCGRRAKVLSNNLMTRLNGPPADAGFKLLI